MVPNNKFGALSHICTSVKRWLRIYDEAIGSQSTCCSIKSVAIAKNHASNVVILFSNYHTSKYSRTLWLNIKYRHTLCI